MNRQDYLKRADEIICNDRQAVHGDASDCFSLIAYHWSKFVSHKLKTEVTITPAEVGIMMALFKLSRWQMNPGHADNIVDALGYLALSGEIQDGDKWET